MKRAFYLIVMLVALASTVAVALAQPPVSHFITGNITRTDGRPAPDNTQVWATVDDYTSPKENVRNGVYFVSVGPPEGRYLGRSIRFWVDEDGAGPMPEVEATPPQAITFVQAATTRDFNLTYTPLPPPTPTPTPRPPTPTPTPRPGATPIPTLPPTGTSAFLYLALGVAGLGLSSLVLGAWAWRRGRARA